MFYLFPQKKILIVRRNDWSLILILYRRYLVRKMDNFIAYSLDISKRLLWWTVSWKESNNRIREHEVWSWCSRDIFDILNFNDRGEPSEYLKAFIDGTLWPSNGYSLGSASHESHFVVLYSSWETRILSRDALCRGYIFSRWAAIVPDRIEIPIPIYQEGAAFQV